MLPEGRATIHQAWSGDVVNAQYYLPEGESIENIGFWYPADGGGMIGSDQMTVLAGAEQPGARPPVHRLPARRRQRPDQLRWLGYQPPQTSIDPGLGRGRRVVPRTSTRRHPAARTSPTGYQLLQLSLAGERLWDDGLVDFTAGA